MKTKYSEKKFKELMLYLSRNSEDDEFFGFTKLNKQLFFCDFISYGLTGKSITGATYQRLNHGPAPTNLVPIRNKLLDSNEIKIDERNIFNKTQKRIVALRPPDCSVFLPRELELINDVVKSLKKANGTQLSCFTHTLTGWKLVSNNEEIPYSTVFLSDDPLTDTDIKRGRAVEKQILSSRKKLAKSA